MFDLEKAINNWVRLFRKYKAFNHGSIREMELHLRDHIDDLLSEGYAEEVAFNMAVKAFGDIKPLASEEYMMLKNKDTSNFKFNAMMLINYVKIAIRNFLKRKSFTALNTIGLSIGMAMALLIFQYVKYEKSFDSFHSRSQDIYRLQYNSWNNGQLNFESAVAVPMAAPLLKKNFEEVEAYTRFLPTDGVMSYRDPIKGNITFYEKRMHFADTMMFNVFDFELLKGNKKTCLKGVDKIIISESTAEKYFDDQEAIGKIITEDGDSHYEVTGIFKDVPENSHIKFDFLISYETLNASSNNNSETSWGWYDFYTFVLLRPNTDVGDLQTKFDQSLEATRKEAWEKYGFKQAFYLKPLNSIHLYSNLLYEAMPNEQGDGDTVEALWIIGIFIMIIAWVNYVNLSTALSLNRANEVGVRKVMGAVRKQLLTQFITEAFLINLLATLVAIVVVVVSWSYFSNLSGWNIPIDFIFTISFWGQVLFLFILGVILSGFYPAIILSSLKPATVLKGKINKSAKGGFLRKSLVVFQFTASVFLISGSVIVFQQLDFMKTKDLGVDINQTLVLNGPRIADSLNFDKISAFKQSLINIPGVKSVSTGTNIPGKENYWTSGITRFSGADNSRHIVTTVAMDYEYIPSFNLEIVAGRNFNVMFPNDENRIILNEALAKLLQFENAESAVGQRVIYSRDTLEIIGIVKDYHQMSLKTDVIPIAHLLASVPSYIAVKVETDNYKQLVSAIQTPWVEYFPEDPIDYFFLDEFFNKQYDKDERQGKVFTLFTILAIFIASLGLIGLASYVTVQRTKEIGIRKVLGSSIYGIVMLLSKGFLQPILIANLIAWPLSWLIMDRWLQSFPYHISINPLIYFGAGIIIILISFVAVGSQTLRAAFKPPAKSLKYE